MSSPVLSIQGLSVNIGQRELLRDIDLNCAENGFHVVMGPVGVGKSTLMSVLSARPHAEVHITTGQVLYRGKKVGPKNHPAIVRQASREEQKAAPRSAEMVMRLIDEALADNPAALCLDEPTASLAHEEMLPILQRLKQEARNRAILMVTHNTEQARLVGDWLTIIGGGRVIEYGPVDDIFAAPQNAATKQFLRTGSMSLPRPDAHARTLAPELRGLPQLGKDLAAEAVEEGLFWIVRRGFALLQLEAAKSLSPDDIVARLREHEFTAVIPFSRKFTALRDALASASLEVLDPPTFSRQRAQAVQASLAYAKGVEARIAAGQHVVAISQGNHAAGARLAATLLINRGLTAKDAIELVNSKVHDKGLSVEEEQFLWDVELALDLQVAHVAE